MWPPRNLEVRGRRWYNTLTMKIIPCAPGKTLNRTYFKTPVERSALDSLKKGVLALLDQSKPSETEEFHKALVRDFLLEAFYKGSNFINTKGTTDLVIHTGTGADSDVAVLLELKNPKNKAEMISAANPNTKALHELILYYLRERILSKNLRITRLIITNINEWYIFDGSDFDRLFARDLKLTKDFRDFSAGRLSSKTTSVFYDEILYPYIQSLDEELPCAYINLQNYRAAAESSAGDSGERPLVALCKILSPSHLLKLPIANDNNSLDQGFYNELLHMLGLRERQDAQRKLIERKPEDSRSAGSLLENTITQLQQRGTIGRLKQQNAYGDTTDARLENVALELCITWINRLIFMKLLEAQQILYLTKNGGRFVDSAHISGFHDVDTLFFGVLNMPRSERTPAANRRFPNVPYLNSSLFEPTDLENNTITISNLDGSLLLPLSSSTVLRNDAGKRETGELSTLMYLLRFLDAYNFASEGDAAIEKAPRTLISASVLGLIFEKINGYKDGSYYTPGSITMFLSREAIRQTIVAKFRDIARYKTVQSFEDLKDQIDVSKTGRQEANDIIDSIRIVDPAVGSGHFLVSALNELLSIKSELGVFNYRDGGRVKLYALRTEHDELTILDEESGEPFRYHLSAHGQPIDELQRLQESVFHEKRKIIENCLFGVDINENSVKICRLRLWIELLKNAYYTATSDFTELETLPNIETNIKRGNSLVSEYILHEQHDTDAPPSMGNTAKYIEAVAAYRSAQGGERKRALGESIEKIKLEARETLSQHDPLFRQLNRARDALALLVDQRELFGLSRAERAKRDSKISRRKKEIESTETKIRVIRDNAIFRQGFEWRYEFPEILVAETGDFAGFDVVVANPPYMSAIEMSQVFSPELRAHLKSSFGLTNQKTIDIYVMFFELALRLLKPGGRAAMITPNKFLSVSYGEALRRYLVDASKIDKVVDYSAVKVFREASVYPVVTFLTKTEQGETPVLTAKSEGGAPPATYRSVPAALLKTLPDYIWGFLLNDQIELTQKIMHQCVSLTSAGTINATSTTSEAAHVHTEIVDGGRGFRLINTGTIDPWVCLWGARKLRDKGALFLRPTISRKSPGLTPNRKALYGSPKIIFAKSALYVEAFYDADGSFASINTNCIHSFDSSYDPKYVLGWVHSRLFHYVYTCFFDSNRMNGGYLPFNAPSLRAMCIKPLSASRQQAFVRVVEQILSIKAKSCDSSVATEESQLNELFYDEFGLSNVERAEVERLAQGR